MKSKNYLLIINVFAIFFFSCDQQSGEKLNKQDQSEEILKIGQMLDSFNLAAARSDYDKYFAFMSEDAVFIGTDATEYWKKSEFMKWAKPYFDKKKTWDFKAFERHVYFYKRNDIAWFDELLNTQMKICRGSGVLIKAGENWKIKQYVLSMTIPNSCTQEVVKTKAKAEDQFIKNRNENLKRK